MPAGPANFDPFATPSLAAAPGDSRIGLDGFNASSSADHWMPPLPVGTIAEFVVNAARLRGFKSSQRQPMPGSRKFREGCLILSPFLQRHRDLARLRHHRVHIVPPKELPLAKGQGTAVRSHRARSGQRPSFLEW